MFDDDAGVVRACGGYIPSIERGGGDTYTNRCFTFDGFKWQENMPPSTEEHSSSSSFNVPDIGWWIFDAEYSRLESSEVFNKEGVWEPGPSQPSYNGSDNLPDDFCSVQLNATHTAIIGGKLSDTSIADVMFYDWTTSAWTPGPPLQTPRREHDCTSFGNSRMMVAGGTSLFGEEVASVEIYDSAIDSWYYTEDLPEKPSTYYDELITWAGNPVWLNYLNIWKFEEGVWSQLDSSLTGPYFNEDFLLMVPDDFIPSC